MAAPRDRGHYIILNAGTRDAIDSWKDRINENIATWTPSFMDPNKNQIWRFDLVEGDYYRIVNVETGSVWELVNTASTDGKNILTKDCANDNKFQHWKFIKSSGGAKGLPESYQIVNRAIDNTCADLKNGGGTSTQVLGWTKGDKNPHQTWIFVPIVM